MTKDRFSPSELRDFLKSGSDADQIRKYYVYQLGSTFLWLGILETTLTDAMVSSDNVKLSDKSELSADAGRRVLKKIEVFKDSTFGSLLKILRDNNFSQREISYLKWIKDKRDFYVHRFFHKRPWPGDMPDVDVISMCRQILYLEHIFRRASNKMFDLFCKSGLMSSVDLGPDGKIFMTPGSFGSEENWMQDLIIDLVRERARRQRD